MLWDQATHDGMAGFVVRGIQLLLVRHDHGFALCAHHDLVLGHLEFFHFDDSLTRTRREQGSLVHQVGEVGTREAWRTASDIGRNHIITERNLAHVNLENLLPATDVRQTDHDLAVEPTRAQQGRIKHVRTVGRGDNDNPVVRFEAVHLDQQLVQSLLTLIVTTTHSAATVPTDRINLVDEYDAGSVLLGLLEHIPDPACANPDEHFHKIGSADAEKGHDWFHIERVYKNAIAINKAEKANDLVIQLAALLHDIADSKFNDGNEEIGPQTAGTFLRTQNLPEDVIVHVQQIIRNLSYSANLGTVGFQSHELNIVRDADRLDAMGAIGIARAFTYGGYKNREMYNPAIPPRLDMTKEEYKASTAPTINHFYEKLLHLKDLMLTKKGKEMAEARHQFMLSFLDQFYKEWNETE